MPDILIAPFPQPGREYMSVEIHNHRRYYIRSRGSKQPTLRRLPEPEHFLPEADLMGETQLGEDLALPLML